LVTRRVRNVLLVILLLGPIIYLPWETPESATAYSWMWDRPPGGTHLSFSDLILNYVCVIPFVFLCLFIGRPKK
ncbi:MAG: hypothetical protein KC800_13060, partial [Candidatus Eremiobacteraeota bacterium]|nr:hypothetical protein [Candidatus Eremiobacteraeota bacterium]